MTLNIEPYQEKYAEVLSNIVTRNFLEVNIKDYSLEKMEKYAKDFSVKKIKQYAEEREIFVALEKGRVVGTLSVAKDLNGKIEDYVFLTVFVLPELHGTGIGKHLVQFGETHVREKKGKKIRIPSSITAHNFYEKLGFTYQEGKNPNKDGIIMMEKILV